MKNLHLPAKGQLPRVRPVSSYRRRVSVTVCFYFCTHTHTHTRQEVNSDHLQQHTGWVNTSNTPTAPHPRPSSPPSLLTPTPPLWPSLLLSTIKRLNPTFRVNVNARLCCCSENSEKSNHRHHRGQTGQVCAARQFQTLPKTLIRSNGTSANK